MTEDQPAWKLKGRDERKNVAAIQKLFEGIPAPDRVIEFFGGIGGMTRVIRGMWAQAEIQSWDKDEQCVSLISRIDRVEVIHGDSLLEAEVRPDDGVLMDFNLWTLKRALTVYKDIMSRVFQSYPRWVQVTDSSRGKLHLNFRSYGLEYPDWGLYIEKVKEWSRGFGYALARVEESHFKTSMLLFVKVRSRRTR